MSESNRSSETTAAPFKSESEVDKESPRPVSTTAEVKTKTAQPKALSSEDLRRPPANFFAILDLKCPECGGEKSDLNAFFRKKAYENSCINPYDKSGKVSEEPLLKCSELPLYDYQPDQVLGMCYAVKLDWKLPMKLLVLLLGKPSHHYELGHSLIFEWPAIFDWPCALQSEWPFIIKQPSTSKKRLGTYLFLTNYINAIEAVILFLFTLGMFIFWGYSYMTEPEYKYFADYLSKYNESVSWHVPKIFLGPTALILSIWSFSGLSF
ncbi:hypothetical protein BCR33DRAFT_187846 [Rhizoclosmatium globosum]|uniref:Uncharacterized protein n=1 Tax=Rhizoclosmatium globosum TaxID=329046 RepID=A0A1Y2D1Y0_9FUNG|nr:hypothetical protein BCR33DRAFT_187846 [Rhizoclosmatium globosum]|eukprot:ORY53126.1 hypothetical protein BCR33DRAFT_187846 [Rhizoclosmatium globosum]